MAELAKRVVLDMPNRKLLIDDVEFPWYIAEDGVQLDGIMATDTFPTVTVTIMATSIEVIPDGR